MVLHVQSVRRTTAHSGTRVRPSDQPRNYTTFAPLQHSIFEAAPRHLSCSPHGLSTAPNIAPNVAHTAGGIAAPTPPEEVRIQRIGCSFSSTVAGSTTASSFSCRNAALRRHCYSSRYVMGIRATHIERALNTAGLTLPASQAATQTDNPVLNKPLQRVLSEFVRRTRITLPTFTELLRGQTTDDYRPNKNIVPAILTAKCKGYRHLPCLLDIAQHGARVPLSQPLPRQSARPPNNTSADDRYNVLIRNIRKEQDAWRCIVVDEDILDLWSEVHISSFGVVGKGNGDPQTTGRVIHDLSCPVNKSLKDCTDQSAVCAPIYDHCDAIATEIVRQQSLYPGCEVKEQAGDFASAYLHVCIHSHCAHLFRGRLPRDNALVIDTSAAFGWSGSPGNHAAVGGAISFIHGHTTNAFNPTGFFSYHWVDDHINVAADVGSNCQDMELSLRYAMFPVLSPTAINEEKFSYWCTRQKALGLVFDSTSGTVSMPAPKVIKAESIVMTTLRLTRMRRS